MDQTINISIEFFLMLLFGGVTLFVTAPMAWILYNVVQDQKELENNVAEDHKKLESDFVDLKDVINKEFVRKEDLNIRLDQVTTDVSEIKKIQFDIIKMLKGTDVS